MNDIESSAGGEHSEPKWRVLDSMERRVLGVLVEKAKTTPDNYPLSLNALTNGCNQKSNRDPQMSLESHQVEDCLEKLREMNAVAEIQGEGRVAKYRHYAYDWFGVDKFELAVMTELLLRGAQTIGELRGRAARMDPIPDLATLKPIVESLIKKGLVVSLTPPGRGQIVTHNLYTPDQLEKVKQKVGSSATTTESTTTGATSVPVRPSTTDESRPRAAASNSGSISDIEALRSELDELKSEVARLKTEVDDLWSSVGKE